MTTTTDETLAGPLARWPRSQPGVFEIASRSRQSSSIEGESYSHTLDVAPTDSRTLYRRRRRAPIVRIRLCCRVCTLHCRFTYKAAHRAAGCIHPPPHAAGFSHPIGLPYGRPPHHLVCLRLPVVVRVCASVKEIVPIVIYAAPVNQANITNALFSLSLSIYSCRVQDRDHHGCISFQFYSTSTYQ
jgi:hypothetical protein